MGLRIKSTSLKAGLLATALMVTVSGCATPEQKESKAAVVMYDEIYDPLEPLNRYFFDVNYALASCCRNLSRRSSRCRTGQRS